MSTWEYVISYPIEDAHYGRYRFHYRCVSQGRQLQCTDMNTHQRKRTLYSCAKLWFKSSWLQNRGSKKSSILDSFQSFFSWRLERSTERLMHECTLTFPLHSSSENLPKSHVWKVKCNQCFCISFGREPPPTNPQNTRTLWWISVSREMKWKRLGSVFSISSHHLFSNQRRKSELCVCVCVWGHCD